MRLFHGRGDMSANVWCALYISQSMGDLMHFYPNIGETHFRAVYGALEKLLGRRGGATWQLLASGNPRKVRANCLVKGLIFEIRSRSQRQVGKE